HILDDLSDKKDARVEFIHQHVTQLHSQLEALGSTIRVEHGSPAEVWKRLLDELPVGAVYTNHDYEPYALQRDEEVRRLLAERQIPLHTYKDHVIFERQEVVKDDGLPYTIFTPYSRKWRATLLSRTASSDSRAMPAPPFTSKATPTSSISIALLPCLPLPYPLWNHSVLNAPACPSHPPKWPAASFATTTKPATFPASPALPGSACIFGSAPSASAKKPAMPSRSTTPTSTN
ncbi:MAG TPA: deoxyribodipyrimidine photo-lyase, partial [Saprospiraceae bacterium]|nr:deoxyribodipyrimidine photo-lyase [Saprospiraceae bacterium]